MTETHLYRARRALPLGEWSPVDRELWNASLRRGDLLEDGGSRAGHAPSSNQKVVKGYSCWLGWLAESGLLKADVPPASRITSARVGAYLQALQKTHSTGSMINLLEDLYAAARVFDPDCDWSWIRTVISRIHARHVPTDRKRDRIVSPVELFELGRDLMRRAASERAELKRALTYRDGLMISVLSARPLRLKNLLGLELSRTFVRWADTWWIDIPAEETKTKELIEIPLPDELTPAVDAYLREHRPVLCLRRGRWVSPVGNALWVSADGSPMRDRSTHQMIVEQTKAAFGHPVNPHLFRDCVATSVAVDDPNHFGIAARLLGHRNQATTERYYDLARSIDAIRRHQELIIGIREGTIQPGHGEEEEP
jgi:integrase/recombinase XerD